MTYQQYLESEHWHELRQKAVNLANRKCEACGCGGRLDGHHLRYAPDLTDCQPVDVMALCRCCHETLHEFLDTKGLTTLEDRALTIAIIRRLRGKKTARISEFQRREVKIAAKAKRKRERWIAAHPRRKPEPVKFLNSEEHARRMYEFEIKKAQFGSVGGIPMPENQPF